MLNTYLMAADIVCVDVYTHVCSLFRNCQRVFDIVNDYLYREQL